MKLEITETTKIKDLQKKFSEVYPFLKIEFYKTHHPEKIFCDKLFTDMILSEIARFSNPGSIHIDQHRRITEVEDEFYNKFGIALQVTAKSRRISMTSSFTDNTTLKEQNELGKRMYERVF